MQFQDEQAASRIVLEDGTVLTACERCRSIYAERTPPGAPPCESCRVELMVENEEIAHIYLVTRGQYVTAGPGQVVDISIPAVKIAMDLHGVRDQKECLMRVRRIFHHNLRTRDGE